MTRQLRGIDNKFRKGHRKSMDGKIFKRQVDPQNFVFDLQRFTTWTLTQDTTDTTKLKLTNGTAEYTGTAAEIIGTAVTGEDGKTKLADGDTIQLGGDISGEIGALTFNSGIALTLDLNNHSITNSKYINFRVAFRYCEVFSS